MSEIYIFSQDDDLLAILSESTGLISAPFKDHLNSVPDEPFVFIVDADEERAKYVKEENRVVFKDKDGFFREMVIKELDDIDNNDGPQTTATCLPAWLDELSENYVLDKRYTDKEAQLALDDALAGTRYIGEVEVSLGLASTNFYKLTSADCIWKIIKVWGGEFKDVVEFTGNKITKRKIIIKQRLGADNGASFEIDHNIEEIQRTVLSYPKTAMYGWGASLEIEDEEGNHTGGYTRYIDFADVEWSVAKGDPVDKPKGPKWVGDPDALQKYGRKHEGKLLHRYGEFSNQEIEDPEELLWATWNNLQEAKKPEINYRLSVDMLDKDASLGDTARAIDREFARPIEIQTRVIAIEYDLLDIEGTTVVEMGQFLDLDDDRLDRLEEYIEENQGKWGAEAGPITNDRFPDIRPGIPSNVEAHGAFQTIQLFWDYGSEVYISHYEVYGSQVKDFVPDTQHLLWRGRVSAFNHEVDTDQTWYYRVRAVNTRGTASDYSPQVSASTVRIITDDILFGSIIADHLENNLDIADKLAQNTIDRINEGPLKEIVYTQQQIEATEERLTKELNSRIGDVSASIDGLYDVADDLKTRADETDELLAQYGGKFTSIETEIDDIEGRMSATIKSVERIDGTVNSHSAELIAQADLIAAKVDDLTYQRDKDGIIESIEANATELNFLAEGLELTVTKEEFEALRIVGRNYFVIKDAKEDTLLAWVTGQEHPEKGSLASGFISVEDGDQFVCNESISQLFYFDANKNLIVTSNMTPGYSFKVASGLGVKFIRITFRGNFLDGRKKEDVRVQLGKGNKITDWTPAPEDTEAEITGVRDRVTTTEATLKVHAEDIKLKAERNEVYTKSQVDTSLGKKVDTTVYNSKVGELTTSIDRITGRVSKTETNINSLTGEMTSAKSEIASLKIEADKIETSVSSLESNVGADKNFRMSKTLSSTGWYRIASNAGNRAFARFIMKDTQSGRHTTAVFNAGITYSRDRIVTLIGYSKYTNASVTKARIVYNGTYDPAYLEIYVDAAPAVIEIFCLENIQSTGWDKVNFTTGTIPSGYKSDTFNIDEASLVDVTGENTAKDTKYVNGVSASQVTTRLSSAETNISQNAREIGLRANEINLIDGRLKTAESTLKVMPDQIDLKVTQGLGSLQIGGRNLSPNSSNLNGHWGGGYSGAKLTYSKVDMSDEWGFSEAYRIKSTGGTALLKGVWSSQNKISEPMNFNDTYTYSLYVKNMGNYPVRIHLNGLSPSGGSQATELQKNESKRVVMSGVRRKDYDWFQSVLRVTDVSHTIDIIVGREQVEKGNKATDWSPAPEDQVDKTNVLSSINLSKEGVRIAGDKIHLSGQSLIDDAIIGTAAIANAAITRAKLGTAVVGTAQIENGAITNAKIGNLAVDDAKIADLSVNKLKAGTIDTSIIKIRGGSSTDYSLIDGSFMELRGKYKRTWLGTTTTHDVKTKLQNGHLRFRNDSLNRSLYMAEFGISTYIDGEGESGGSSGTISWWDKTYSTTGANGLTINSHGGVVALESDKNIIAINPFKDDSSSKFWFTRSNDYNDGYLSFGSNLGAPSMALRFFNGKTELAMVDSNYQRGGDTTFDVGNLKVNSIRKRDGSGGVYWNGSSGGTTAGGNLDNTLFATGIRTNDSNIYLATDNGGTVHITDYAGYNNGKGITYRDLYARQIFANTVQFNADAGGTNLYIKPSASGEVKITAPNTTDIFRPLRTSKVYETSSEKFKHDIKRFENSALDLINSSVIYDYEKEGSYGREIGFIIERETPTILINGDAIDGYSHRSLNTKAIQELDTKFYGLENRVEMLELENQYLKQKIKQLEEKIA